MRKQILLSLAAIFSLFSLGILFLIYHLLSTTDSLGDLIVLHEIEDQRQELVFHILNVQNYTYSPPELFAKNLDEIVNSAALVDETLSKCHNCHHVDDVLAELDSVGQLVTDYQEKLSYLITTSTGGERRRQLQKNVADLSRTIVTDVRGMVNRAAATLSRRTSEAKTAINRSFVLLGFTAMLTFIAALFVAQILTKKITRPINELLTAATRLSSGDLGYQTDYTGSDEFGTLINTFNEMSSALAAKEQKIENTSFRLDQLHQMNLPIHSAKNRQVIVNSLRSCLSALIQAERYGIILFETGNGCTVEFTDRRDDIDSLESLNLNKNDVMAVNVAHENRHIMANRAGDAWPFSVEPLKDAAIKNFLIVWLHCSDALAGAIIIINKQDDFQEEDLKLCGILANNISVALENLQLYNDLQQQMAALKKAQDQLVQAEKLTALGTLAGGVAHDFNNILCGMIGYVSLLKRNFSREDKDYKMLETVEKAGFRAANLTKQLLAFARQEVLDKKPLHLNQHITNVVELLKNTITKMITIRLELAEKLPPILSDAAQLEQVVMNLCVNARDAMPDGGEIFIRTSTAIIDQNFCMAHPEARPGRYVCMLIADHGFGIDENIMPRIFEPFFTTKEFGRGTGLGLAMVYGIIKSHQGFCLVESAPEKGTAFNVFLPAQAGTEDETEPKTETEAMLNRVILVVDDEDVINSMLGDHLLGLGCKVFQATNGENAIALLKQHKDEIELVILDIDMPVMDGNTAFSTIRQLRPDLKVLVATGFTPDGKASKILLEGADDFIQKPYSLESITLKIQQLFA